MKRSKNNIMCEEVTLLPNGISVDFGSYKSLVEVNAETGNVTLFITNDDTCVQKRYVVPIASLIKTDDDRVTKAVRAGRGRGRPR